MVRPVVTEFTTDGMSMDFGSWQCMAHSDWGEHLTGCIDIKTKKIYLAPVVPSVGASNPYNSRPRGRKYSKVAGSMLKEIVHDGISAQTNEKASGHEQIATHVIAAGGSEEYSTEMERFGGFALRMEFGPTGELTKTMPEDADFKKHISLSGTSGTLNDGSGRPNRQLEPCILEALKVYLKTELEKVHKVETFVVSGPRTSPTAIATRIGGAQTAGQRGGMLASIKSGLGQGALKKTGL